MTREEAYEWNENTHDVNFPLEVEKMQESIFYLLKKVYDGFESRTCENCKHDYGCDIQDRLELIDYSTGFGCNKFERKE